MPNPTYQFEAELLKANVDGAWIFVEVPEEFRHTQTLAWGRTPVSATVDGRSWDTSVWREKTGRSYLPVPKKIRKKKEPGDSVSVTISYKLEQDTPNYRKNI